MDELTDAQPAPQPDTDRPSSVETPHEPAQRLLDQLWDFGAAEESEARFRAAIEDDAHPSQLRAVFVTQLARALGLQGRFGEGGAVLDELEAGADDDGELRARIALERGRLLNSAARAAEAVPELTRAVREAAGAGEPFLALDALHMLALADVGHEREWAEEGLALLATERDPRVLRWGVALNNNLGWTLHDAGHAVEALVRFEDAARYAERYGTAEQRHIARWSIARCLRTLGRLDEAREIQLALAAERPDDEYVHAELRELGVSDAAPTIEG